MENATNMNDSLLFAAHYSLTTQKRQGWRWHNGDVQIDPAVSKHQALLRIEVALVLLVSLGRAGIYAITSLAVRLTAPTPLRDQRAALNAAVSTRPTVDLIYQLLAIGFALVPIGLVIYLLMRERPAPARGACTSACRRLGLGGVKQWSNLSLGFAFAALIGIPGLGFYLLGRTLGITVHVAAAGEHSYWWTIPVLILAAVKNALVEEIIAVGYLTVRGRQFGWRAETIVLASAALRSSYHLYQGVGAGIGNLVMGIIFAAYFRRTNRLWPLIVAHTLIDVVAFVGYLAFAERLAAWL